MDKPLTALQTIIIHMNTNEHWHDFICYCQHREAGLRKAIELGGDTEQEAMIYLVSNYIHTLEFGTHEFPSGYCGDLSECIEKLPYMLQLINRIQNKNIKEQNIGQIQEQLHLILDWLKHTQTPVDAVRTWEKEQTKELEKASYII